MNINELIEKIKGIDGNKEIFAYYGGDIIAIHDIDELSDRVDINLILQGDNHE